MKYLIIVTIILLSQCNIFIKFSCSASSAANTSIFICLGLRTAMVEALASKTMSWEKERGVEFTYDGVSTSPRSLKVKSLDSWSHLNIYIYIFYVFT